MKNKLFFVSVLATLFMIPLVQATVLYTPYLAGFYDYSIIFLIPTILAEGILAYFLFKKSYNLKIKFWYSLLIFLVANLVSTIVAALLFRLIPFGPDFGGFSRAHPLLILAYLFSVLIEIPVIYLFIKKKSEKVWKVSSFLSLLSNLLSYALIFIFMLLIFFYRIPR